MTRRHDALDLLQRSRLAFRRRIDLRQNGGSAPRNKTAGYGVDAKGFEPHVEQVYRPRAPAVLQMHDHVAHLPEVGPSVSDVRFLPPLARDGKKLSRFRLSIR